MDYSTSTTSSLCTVPSFLLNWEDDLSADDSLEILSLSVQSQETPTTTTHHMTAIQPDTDGESIVGESVRSSESKVYSVVERIWQFEFDHPDFEYLDCPSSGGNDSVSSCTSLASMDSISTRNTNQGVWPSLERGSFGMMLDAQQDSL